MLLKHVLPSLIKTAGQIVLGTYICPRKSSQDGFVDEESEESERRPAGLRLRTSSVA
jgi:hypothetical protein